VFVLVNLLRHFTLLSPNLGALLWSQMAAVSFAVLRDLLVNGIFLALQIGCLPCVQTAALDTLRNAVLLVFRVLAHGTLRVQVLPAAL